MGMPCRMVVVVDEAVMFYGLHWNVYEVDEDGKSRCVMTKMVTHAKTEADGFEGAIDALKAHL